VAISKLGREQRWQEALSTFEGLKVVKLEPDTILRNAVLSAAEKASKWIQVLELFRSGRGDGYPADAYTFTCCLGALGKASGWEAALQMFAEMRHGGPAPSVVTCNAALAALGKGQRWDWAAELLQQMRSGVAGLPSADTVSFNTAAAAMIEAGRWRSAVELCTLLQLEGLQTDPVTHNILVSSCKPDGRWEAALWLLSTRRPQVESVTAAIDTMAACSLWERALSLLCNMPPGLRPNVMTFGAAMNALARGAAWLCAVQLLRVMDEQKVSRNSVVCSCAIAACDEAEEWQQSLAMLVEMLQVGPRPNLIAFNSAIVACAHGRQWYAAVQLFRKLRSSCEPDVVSVSSVLSAFELSQRWAKALGFLLQLGSLGLELAASARTAVFGICGDRWEQALTACPPIAAEWSLAERNAAITALGEAHSWARSTELLTSLLQCGRSPDSVTLGAMVSICARAEEWPCALAIFDALPRLRAAVDLVCSNAAASAPKKRCWQQTLSLLQSLPLRRLRSDIISANAGLGAWATVSCWQQGVNLVEHPRGSLCASITVAALLLALLQV
ncbi:unnamed protein product, partial [Symbiodinium sp. CCMP2456]